MEPDVQHMQAAIEWAERCLPVYEKIPKVGAIIADDKGVIGRGRRGTGIEGDDDHAEHDALRSVANSDRSRISKATLYSTLEPCTREVRTKPLECCTELILQNQIGKVFVGILDPNQEVRGKGILELQTSGVDVALFPHDLAKQIRALNAPFIRSQQSLGANIIGPKNGEPLKTYQTGGRHPVRFTCLNSPTADNYLLSFYQGVCWPQPGPFRHVEGKIWEIDAFFGATGEHTLQIVSANEIGRTLIAYYWRVVNANMERKRRIGKAFGDPKITKALGGDYLGIEMTAPPKGLRSEASVNVMVEGRE